MIKHIIFDIGGVLLTWNPLQYLERIYQDEDKNELFKIIFQNPSWVKMDEGTIKEEDFFKNVIKAHPDKEKDIRYIQAHWYEILQPLEKNVALLEELKKDYDIYLLSNFPKEAFAYVDSQYAFLSDVDGAIISSDVHLLKPNEKMYQALTDTYHLKADECLFIDDNLPNITACEALGWQGLWVKGNTDLTQTIKDYLKPHKSDIL